MTEQEISKAVRASILVGDIELDIYQLLPSKQYVFSKADLKKKLSIQASDQTGKKYAQPILQAHSNRLSSIRAVGAKREIHAIPLDVVALLIQAYAKLGNPICIAIAIASVAESLERRANAVFKVDKTEDEYNIDFSIRCDRVLARNCFELAVARYILRHPEMSDRRRNNLIINCSNHLNRLLFGYDSKTIRIDIFNIGKNSPRDFYPHATQKLVENIEISASLKVDNLDVYPETAIKETIFSMGIKPDIRRLGSYKATK